MFNDFGGGTETNEFLKSRGFEIITEDKANLNSLNEKFDLEKLILEYYKNKDFFGKRKITEEQAMQFRLEFISDFTIDKILDISIDNYVQGKKLKDTGKTNKKTFCYRLEWGLPGFGSLGGVNTRKFGIYYSSNDKKYVYNEKKLVLLRKGIRKSSRKLIFSYKAESNLPKIMTGKNYQMHLKVLMKL